MGINDEDRKMHLNGRNTGGGWAVRPKYCPVTLPRASAPRVVGGRKTAGRAIMRKEGNGLNGSSKVDAGGSLLPDSHVGSRGRPWASTTFAGGRRGVARAKLRGVSRGFGQDGGSDIGGGRGIVSVSLRKLPRTSAQFVGRIRATGGAKLNWKQRNWDEWQNQDGAEEVSRPSAQSASADVRGSPRHS